MKILFINTIDNVGGAALVGWNLSEVLLKKGHDPKYMVGFKKSKDKYVYQLRRNILLNYLTTKTNIDFNFIFCGLLTKFLANDIDFGAKEEVLNHPWYKKADIIHCNNLHGNYIKLDSIKEMSKEKKIVWTLHDEWAIMAHGSCIVEDGDKPVDGLYRRTDLNLYPAMLWNNEKYLSSRKSEIYKNSNLHFVVPSKWLLSKVKKSVLKDNDIQLIHNGIDINIFKKYDKNSSRSKLGLPLDKKIILFVANSGTNNPLKGWSYIEKIIDYFKDNDNLFFLCIGGSERDERKTGSNVRYVKYINNNNLLAQYYSSSDIFLFTSLVESFGLVPIEAMSCGLPVVAFPVGIIPEVIIHKKNGYIARHKDADDLIKGVEYIMSLSDSTLLNISSDLTKEIKKNFSLDKMTGEYLKLYNRLLEK